MEGVADKVRIDNEGDEVALRFVLRPAQGHPVAVELRGEEVHGVLDNGDAVKLSGMPPVQPDGLQRPRLIENKTTGSTITVRRTSAAGRGARQVRTVAASALVSTVVGGAVKPVATRARSVFKRGDRSPRPRPRPRHGAAKALAVVAVATVPVGIGAVVVGKEIFEGDTKGVFTVKWSPSSDATGYSVAWTRRATDVPDKRPELSGRATSVRSRRLPEGRWYLHRRTIGGSKANSVVHSQPFVVPPD